MQLLEERLGALKLLVALSELSFKLLDALFSTVQRLPDLVVDRGQLLLVGDAAVLHRSLVLLPLSLQLLLASSALISSLCFQLSCLLHALLQLLRQLVHLPLRLCKL